MYLRAVSSPVFTVIDDDDDLAPPPAPVKPPLCRGGRPHAGGRPRNKTDTPRLRARRMADDRKNGREIEVVSAATAPDVVDEDTITTNDDLAAVVVRRTLKEMAAGKVRPTLRDGLAAQQLLDRRAEKAADRSFMLNLALALAGGGQQVPQKLLPAPSDSPEDVIEGEFTEENLAPAHLRSG